MNHFWLSCKLKPDADLSQSAWRRASRDLQEDIDIGLSRSTDGGRTWEPPRVIMDMGGYGGKPQHENRVSDPGIVIDQATGEIFVFPVWMWGKPGGIRDRQGGAAHSRPAEAG